MPLLGAGCPTASVAASGSWFDGVASSRRNGALMGGISSKPSANAGDPGMSFGKPPGGDRAVTPSPFSNRAYADSFEYPDDLVSPRVSGGFLSFFYSFFSGCY